MKKNFAVWAKRKMHYDIVKRSEKLGILCDDYEKITYTWFIRLIAIRFMEVNNFFGNKRILSSSRSNTETPDIIDMPFEFGINFNKDEKEKILFMKEEGKLDELFTYLFIYQCNKLEDIFPLFFEKTDEVEEKLLILSYKDKNGVIYRLLQDVDESELNINSTGKIEIIGWIYQNYNSDAKAEAFSMLKNHKKIEKENIPAATQLFTPEWIVKYMVENSIGCTQMDGNDCGKFKYFLQEPVDNFNKISIQVKVEDIKIIEEKESTLIQCNRGCA